MFGYLGWMECILVRKPVNGDLVTIDRFTNRNMFTLEILVTFKVFNLYILLVVKKHTAHCICLVIYLGGMDFILVSKLVYKRKDNYKKRIKSHLGQGGPHSRSLSRFEATESIATPPWTGC